MDRIIRAIPAFFACLFFGASVAHGDWDATYTATSTAKEFPKTVGKFFSKGDRFRVDTPYPFDMSIYGKAGSNRIYAAVHSFRIRLSSNLGRYSGQVPGCISKAFSECVRTLKLKKVGSEKCDDGKQPRTCDVYEGVLNRKGVKKVKLWHWQGEKEPVLRRSVITQSNGSEIRTEFTEISRQIRPDAHYVFPANYKDAGSIERFLGDFQGRDE